MKDSTYLLVREVGSGMISLMLIVLTVTLIRYLYRHWAETAKVDREARNIAIGLSLFFGSVAVRSMELWLMLVTARHRLTIPDFIDSTFQSFILYLIILGCAVVGAIYTVRSLNPGPIWTFLIALCVIIPIVVVFI